MKFQLVEKSVRDVDAPVAQTLHIGDALSDLSVPEIKSALIGNATEEIVILLLHEERRFLERIPEQLAANLAVREGSAVHIHVMQSGLQMRHLLCRGIDLKVNQRAPEW